MIGVAAGSAWWTNSHNGAALKQLETKLDRMLASSESAARPAAAGNCVVSVDSRVLRDSVRSAVAEVCSGPNAAILAAQVEASPKLEEGSESDKVEPSPEMLQSYDAANGLVERALTARTWTSEDVEKLRPLMAELDDDSREEIVLRVVRSFNEGKLEFTGRPGEMF
jgi:hypothetical protein